MVKIKVNRELLPVKAHYFFFFAALGPLLPQLNVYGRQLGVSPDVMGLVTAVLPLLWAVAKPCFGYLVDYFTSQRKLIFMLLIVTMSSSYCCLWFLPEPDHSSNTLLKNMYRLNGTVYLKHVRYTSVDHINMTSFRDFTEPESVAQKYKCFWDCSKDEHFIIYVQYVTTHVDTIYIDEDITNGTCADYGMDFVKMDHLLECRVRNSCDLMCEDLNDIADRNIGDIMNNNGSRMTHVNKNNDIRPTSDGDSNKHNEKAEYKFNINQTNESTTKSNVNSINDDERSAKSDVKVNNENASTSDVDSNKNNDSTRKSDVNSDKDNERAAKSDVVVNNIESTSTSDVNSNKNNEITIKSDVIKNSDSTLTSDINSKKDDETTTATNAKSSKNIIFDTNKEKTDNKYLDGKTAELNTVSGVPDLHNVTYSFSTNPDLQTSGEQGKIYGSVTFWAFVILMCLGTVAFNVANCISDAICFDVLGVDRASRYGSQRAWGTAGYGITAFLGGWLIDLVSEGAWKNFAPAFGLAVVFTVLDIISCRRLTLPRLTSAESETGRAALRAVLRCPRVLLFILFAVIAGMFDSFIIYYMFWYIEELAEAGGTQNVKLLEGVIVFGQSFIGELAFFFLSGRILKRFGYGNTMTFSLLCYGVRLAFVTFVTNPWHLVPFEAVMQGPTYALCYATIVGYAAAVAPEGHSATMQGIVAGMDDGVGFALGSLVGGQLYKYAGGRSAFRVMSLVAVAAGALHALLHATVLAERTDLKERSSEPASPDERQKMLNKSPIAPPPYTGNTVYCDTVVAITEEKPANVS